MVAEVDVVTDLVQISFLPFLAHWRKSPLALTVTPTFEHAAPIFADGVALKTGMAPTIESDRAVMVEIKTSLFMRKG